ncbi:MAG: DUF1295 domain-containing protein [Candidatus Paceibacterota bacterium]
METFTPLILVFGTILSYTLVAFLVSVFLKNNNVADVAYGLGFVVVSWVLFLRNGIPDFELSARWIVVLLITLWGLRLSIYLGIRAWKKAEDWRYAIWRDRWGVVGKLYFYVRSFVQIYLLQAFLIYLVLVPVIHMLVTGTSVDSKYFIVGVIVFALGFLIETVADIQLYRFKKNNPPDTLFTKGLFAYSRHPNYFGEMLVWWGFFIMTLASSNWFLTIISPIAVTYILYAIAGPMVEAHLESRALFSEYKKKTRYFFPGQRSK